MVWTTFQFSVAAVSLIMCTCCTILVKSIARTESVASDGEKRVFHHPIYMTHLVFVGEMPNLIWYHLLCAYLKSRKNGSVDTNKFTKGNRDINPLYHCIPAMFDLVGSIIQFIGLHLTYASSFQALKISVIFFTAIFSIIFLKRKICLRRWGGIFLTIVGCVFVTLGDYIAPRTTPDVYQIQDIITGDILVVVAQIVSASQMVIEEFLVLEKDIQPLQTSGWQGIFGFTVMLILQVIFYFIPCPRPIAVNSRQTFEDAIDALIQISNSTNLMIFIAMFTLFIGICKVAGINLTKEFSCVTRRVFDSLRIVFLYIYGIIYFGQVLHYFHPIGFACIIFGVSLHNNVINLNTAKWIGRKFRCIKPQIVEEESEEVYATAAENTEKK